MAGAPGAHRRQTPARARRVTMRGPIVGRVGRQPREDAAREIDVPQITDVALSIATDDRGAPTTRRQHHLAIRRRLPQRARVPPAAVKPRQPRRRDLPGDRRPCRCRTRKRPGPFSQPGPRLQTPPAVQDQTAARTDPLPACRTSARPRTGRRRPRPEFSGCRGHRVTRHTGRGHPPRDQQLMAVRKQLHRLDMASGPASTEASRERWARLPWRGRGKRGPPGHEQDHVAAPRAVGV